MTEKDVADVVDGTDDAAFAVASDGVVRRWNAAAERLFGIPASKAVGTQCCALLCGLSSLGAPVCRPDCMVRQRMEQGNRTSAFDMEVKTVEGRRWVNISIIMVPGRLGKTLIHLVRDVHSRKQIEDVTRGFLGKLSSLSGVDDVDQALARDTVPHLDLTARETAVLRPMVEGKTTKAMSEELHVSSATVRNHVDHILQKLSAHSRVEAVLRAIREKLV